MDITSYDSAKLEFDTAHKLTDTYKVMQKATKLVNDTGRDFLSLDGTELYQMRSRLASYKFYLADSIHDANRVAKSLKVEIKQVRAKEWNRISDEIKSTLGKVPNIKQIENELEKVTEELQHKQILYETLYYTYNLKISSIDDVLMAISQRIKALQKEEEQAMYTN